MVQIKFLHRDRNLDLYSCPKKSISAFSSRVVSPARKPSCSKIDCSAIPVKRKLSKEHSATFSKRHLQQFICSSYFGLGSRKNNRTPQIKLHITYLHKWGLFISFLEWKMDFLLRQRHKLIIIGSANAWYQSAKVLFLKK